MNVGPLAQNVFDNSFVHENNDRLVTTMSFFQALLEDEGDFSMASLGFSDAEEANPNTHMYLEFRSSEERNAFQAYLLNYSHIYD